MVLLLCGGSDGSKAPDVALSADEAKADRELKKAQAETEAQEEKKVKMLLLGAGESGKSTIFKQMKVINKDGYSKQELAEFKGIVHANACASMKSMIKAYEKLQVEVPADLQTKIDQFLADSTEEKLNPELAQLIKALWDHESMQAMFIRRSEFQLNDSAEYYFKDIERISGPEYQPTTDDVLRSRVRTTGIVQSDFAIKGLNFAMFDVGGQRNERRKWIHCFDNVQCVVFVASLSEFDQVLFEDETQNRLDEALDLFKQIVLSKWFAKTSMMLFLNKKDLFENKLKDKVFADYINKDPKRTPYNGPNEMMPCAEYCKGLFLAKNTSDKSVYCHITNATDTGNVKFVFQAVVSMIFSANMAASGMA